MLSAGLSTRWRLFLRLAVLKRHRLLNHQRTSATRSDAKPDSLQFGIHSKELVRSLKHTTTTIPAFCMAFDAKAVFFVVHAADCSTSSTTLSCAFELRRSQRSQKRLRHSPFQDFGNRAVATAAPCRSDERPVSHNATSLSFTDFCV